MYHSKETEKESIAEITVQHIRFLLPFPSNASLKSLCLIHVIVARVFVFLQDPGKAKTSLFSVIRYSIPR
jgi:hypothetical protein